MHGVAGTGKSIIFAPPKKTDMAKSTKEETIVDVQQIYTKTELFVDRNRKPLLIVLGAIAAIVIGVFAYQYLYKAPREAEASTAMWKAEQYMEMDSLDWAANGHGEYVGFAQIIEDYSGTRAAKRAHYWMGIISRSQANWQEALTHFEEADFDDETVGVMALGNVGDMYVELDNFEDGARYLEKAAKKAASSSTDRFLAPIYYLKAARVNMELGNNDKAKSLLKQITENYKGISSVQNEYAEALKLHSALSARKD
jgi:tetratricopeptide (TPR) repeat protein